MSSITLKDNCLKQIVYSILNSPPEIKETIVNESLKSIKKELCEEIENDIKTKILNDLSFLLPEIIENIIQSTQTGLNKVNFEELYKDIDRDTMHKANKISQEVSSKILNNNIYYFENIENIDREYNYDENLSDNSIDYDDY